MVTTLSIDIRSLAELEPDGFFPSGPVRFIFGVKLAKIRQKSGRFIFDVKLAKSGRNPVSFSRMNWQKSGFVRPDRSRTAGPVPTLIVGID
jgi:hypothetical protein